MNEIVDYAMPLMQIEKLTKKVHDLCLDKRYLDAANEIVSIEYQAAILRENLISMQVKEVKR